MSMEFEWDKNKAEANLSKHRVSFDERKEKIMNKAETEMDDDLRSEYDLKGLRVRKVGPKRENFRGRSVHLEPDVAEIFPDSGSVNEALRFLIRVTQDGKPALTNAPQ